MFRRSIITAICAGLSTAFSAFPSVAHSYCSGSACLQITDVRRGTRCGSGASFEVDIRNASEALYLRGYVIFVLSTGGLSYQPTGLLAPGDVRKGEQYVCSGTGDIRVIANTGPTPPQYPPR